MLTDPQLLCLYVAGPFVIVGTLWALGHHVGRVFEARVR
ncbi:hypothetical protein LDDCCGHA_5226 [Methylobacterium oxalidis]|nr:hypothetical protein LDDCCGHA_5226 [Methylobacterium oxalidis]